MLHEGHLLQRSSHRAEQSCLGPLWKEWWNRQYTIGDGDEEGFIDELFFGLFGLFLSKLRFCVITDRYRAYRKGMPAMNKNEKESIAHNVDRPCLYHNWSGHSHVYVDGQPPEVIGGGTAPEAKRRDAALVWWRAVSPLTLP